MVDTERDLSPAEKHVLQKLFGWKGLVSTVEQFREKTGQCLTAGWNNEGPVRPGEPLKRVIEMLEKEIAGRKAR